MSELKPHFSRRRIYKSGVIAFGVAVLAYLFLVKPPVDVPDNVFEASKKSETRYFPEVHFREVSARVGFEYDHLRYAYGDSANAPELYGEPAPPSIAVVDINRDGFMDVFVATHKDRRNLLYINQGGMRFKEAASEYGLDAVNVDRPSFPLWGDFNGDGRLDLLLAVYGCHRLYLGTAGKKFKDATFMLGGYCSRPNGVNVADLNGTGRLDLVFANFLPKPGENSFNVLWMTNNRYDNLTGGENHVLRNDGDKFRVEGAADFLTRSYSHNAGIADVNLDGKPDIFFANDYSHDQMFLNVGKGRYHEVTGYFIPHQFHGLAGMNTEFFDYDLDGRIDLYVTNIHKPPFNRGFNLLWKKKADNYFENVSTEVGVARCGFSWGSKFADLNNDGEPDLLVTNGRARSPELTERGQGISMWFERAEVSQIPWIVRSHYNPVTRFKGRYISAFEKKCLFMQKDGRFYDIAEGAGFGYDDESRALALIDFDNDGRLEMITGGPTSRIRIFHNESELRESRHWIGFEFEDAKGNRIPHGLRLEASLRNGKKIVRELYPANGYKGFSEPRIHVGLGELSELESIDVFWPLSQSHKRYSGFKVDGYNLIKERTDNVAVH